MVRLQNLKGDLLYIPIARDGLDIKTQKIHRPKGEPHNCEWWVELERHEHGYTVKDIGLHREAELENCTRLEF